MTSLSQQKRALRQTLKQARSSLSESDRISFSALISERLLTSDLLTKAHHIAVYASFGSEVITSHLLNELLIKNFSVYLPQIANMAAADMTFAKYTGRENLIRNQLGILQSSQEKIIEINPCDLDVILLPLLGFDEQGYRLGMGAGYYDKALAPCVLQKHKPLLIGLAFELQKVVYIPREVHDVRLDAVITEQRVYNIDKTLEDKK